MKVLLLAPAPPELYRGRSATVQRYRAGLQRRGHLCEVLGQTEDGGLKQSLEGTIGRLKPDIVHAHDAARTGIGLLGLRLPWVVSLAGDDFNADMMEPGRGPLVCETIRRARRVLVPCANAGTRLEARIPDVVGKVDVVPRSADVPPTHGTDLRRSLGISRSRFLVLLPGGLRPIKGQHRALPLAHALRQNGLDAELIIVGPRLDDTYADAVMHLVQQETGVRVLPALSWERMGAAYADADVVLNTSLSEGMPSTILEAGMLGRPVVASRVPGNEDVIRHKETGLLFDDEAEMVKHVLALARNRAAAGALGLRLREDLRRRFGAEQEIDCLLSSYAAA